MISIHYDNIVTNNMLEYKTKSISEFDKSIRNHIKYTFFVKYT